MHNIHVEVRSDGNLRDWFSPLIWVLGIKLRLSGLPTSVITHWAISLALNMQENKEVLTVRSVSRQVYPKLDSIQWVLATPRVSLLQDLCSIFSDLF